MTCAFLLVLVLVPASGPDAGPTKQPLAVSSLEMRVREAFLAVRRKDFRELDAIKKMGAAVVPAAGRWVDDPDEDVRQEAMILLTAIHTPNALPFMARAVIDPAPGIRERAVTRLYDRFDPRMIAAEPAVGKALREVVQRSVSVAGQILLLAYFPGPETLDALVRVQRGQSDKLVRLHWSDPDVPIELVARAAAARLGERDAIGLLSSSIDHGAVEELTFLLMILREIEAPEILMRLTRTFDDKRPVLVGAYYDGGPPQRLCDLAVDAFSKRLGVKSTFARRFADRYREHEVAEMRRLVLAALAKN